MFYNREKELKLLLDAVNEKGEKQKALSENI